MAINSSTQDTQQNAALDQAHLDDMFDFESFNDADAVFDNALEDTVVECLGSVLEVCYNASRRDDIPNSEVERVMLEGNQIYSKLYNLCSEHRDLFFKIYNTAKAIKGDALCLCQDCKISYENALEKAQLLPNKDSLCAGIEFIRKFRDLVRQRLLLVKPLLVNPHETKQVFDFISNFICYECVFDPAYNK